MLNVLITGTSRGIGRAIAKELTARGHRVIATARKLETLDGLDVAAKVQLDVTDQASVDAAVAAAGPVDALVSNAGTTVRGPVETVPLDAVRDVFELNYFGALRVTQAFLPAMRERGFGRLIYISSLLGRITTPLMSTYSGSKWALEALVEAAAAETAQFGVRVTSLQPGGVESSDSAGAALAAVYLTENDPYRPLLEAVTRARKAPVTAEQVATVVADTLVDPNPPLRIPVGAAALEALGAPR
ncbi:SDR family NAD(P)-dependent oxidoreductase [Actinoplanes sp. Pm04-4]|uniref:SDR family NAD(P)-dependent oxidoreductase n=1 Tax=Paractinoplanes pyxinae TaxID=2997416 RepID=A0ABT4BCG3_9ACTN|nr:SDR family NAD(P)-dependent oxidoreductase [Actinoplanes pyxinae]MCY1144218.1 SDR family NAD(P)-dependent oxidoreductase [Actinoplanes pyxinae]